MSNDKPLCQRLADALFAAQNDELTASPTRSAHSNLLANAPPIADAIIWLVVTSPCQMGAIQELNFFMGAISAPQTKGPNAAHASPAAGRLYWAHGEPRRRDSGPWRVFPWRGRAKPVGVG